jgi:phospholipid-binding lipoprotein MlaA
MKTVAKVVASRTACLWVVTASLALGACATAQNPDPFEPVNRKVYAFNDVVDRAVLKPVATVYKDNVPSPVRTGVTNFFANFSDIWSAINLFLQGRVADGLSDLTRVGTNTVFGVLGLFDVATDLGMERHGQDFGQTLGRWGVGPGAYLVLPLLGPSSGRDVLGLPIEWQISPNQFIEQVPVRNTLTATRIVNTRANLLSTTGLLDDIALDKYSFTRDAYLQRRRSLIYDGNPPDEDAEAPLPAAGAASAPGAKKP